MERLVTERLVVRRFVSSDGPGLHAYLSRPEAVRFEPYPVPSAQDCELQAIERATNPSFWAVCLQDTGAGGEPLPGPTAAGVLAHLRTRLGVDVGLGR